MARRIFHSGPAEPVADLSVDGLAVCYFNDADRDHQLWEVAFLREQKHKFTILITEHARDGRRAGGEGRRYVVPEKVRRLEFIAENGSSEHYEEFPRGCFTTDDDEFRRTIGDDPNDFRWIIDFVGGEVPHGEFRRLTPPSAFDVVLLKIPFSLFYTQRVTHSPMLLLRSDSRNKDESFVFGHTNEVVGAHVLADPPSGAVLRGTDLDGNPIDPFPIQLPHQEGLVYHVTFENMEPKRYELISEAKSKDAPGKGKPKLKQYKPGDFDLFYKVIEVARAERYNLYGPDPTSARGKLGDCNLVSVSGTGTLESLLD